MNLILWLWLKQEIHLIVLMFNLNLIAEPGVQEDSPKDSWSFIRDKKDSDSISSKNLKTISKENINKALFYVYGWAVFVIMFFLILAINVNTNKFSPNVVLNQVIDIIIGSEYMKELQLSEVEFRSKDIQVTISSSNLASLQNFTLGYRKEDKIPYKLYKKNKNNYLSLNFPWQGKSREGDLDFLKDLAAQTVFSNKIIISEKNESFELRGRSSDIISYLLQMAKSGTIQNFIFSVFHLDSGQFFLKIKTTKV